MGVALISGKKAGIYKKCAKCGKEIYVYKYWLKENNYCSYRCWNEVERPEVSQETREKIRSANLGKIVNLETRLKISKKLKGRKAPNKGVPMKEYQKEKITKALTGRVFSEEHIEKISGENHYRWNFGNSGEYSLDFFKMRPMIRYLYNNVCAFCGVNKYKNGRELSVHHIDGDKNNSNIRNLIPLCNFHHNQIESKFMSGDILIKSLFMILLLKSHIKHLKELKVLNIT